MPLENHSRRIISVYAAPNSVRACSASGPSPNIWGGTDFTLGESIRFRLPVASETLRMPIGLHSCSYDASNVSPPHPATQPWSFQPRLTESCMPVFIPNPPVGE